MAFFVYRIIVLLYGAFIRLAAITNPKAKQWVLGRKNWAKQLQDDIRSISENQVVWFHCASYGEFEQGRPLIEAYKKDFPDRKVVLSFFSPSGYEAFKNWPGADVVCYLPLDTPGNAKKFLQIINPSEVFIIKYEYWLCFLRELKTQSRTCYLVSATFKPHHPFFKWYGSIFRQSLQSFRFLFVQDAESLKRLNAIGINRVAVCGDTRIDRVLMIKDKFVSIPEIEKFKKNNLLLVAGSTWSSDEELLIKGLTQLQNKQVKVIVVPHELTLKKQLATAKKMRENGFSVSVYSEGIDMEANILLLNTMGMLSRTYHYADLAYVGGGLEDGIHNILEPAVYGIPVLFAGNTFHKFNEAVKLTELGVATPITDSKALASTIDRLLGNRLKLMEIKESANKYFEENKNVSRLILDRVKHLRQ